MASSDRRPYLTATVLDQALLDAMQDNLEFKLEMIVEIETPTGTIYASDRHKYVGTRFYEALLNFPEVLRTVGEWLSGELEFSSQELRLSNVDGRFNNFLPGGADFDGWIGRQVLIKIGLRDVASTYLTVFDGTITPDGGFKRDKESVVLLARDKFDTLNVTFPPEVLTKTGFTNLEPDKVGLGNPVIYGDWTTNLRELGNPPVQKASVPAFPTNGLLAGVQAGTTSLACQISSHDLSVLETANVFLFRGNEFFKFDVGDITAGTGNRSLTIKQSGNGGTTLIDGSAFIYATGDQFFVRVKGKDLGAFDDNVVWIARDILITYGGLSAGDFDANWTTFRDKSTPAQSDISTLKFRLWRQSAESVMKEVLSLFEQARLEVFVSRDLKLKINSMHFEDFDSAPTFTVRNWDVEQGTFNPQSPDRNQFNRAQADFDFDPGINENRRSTAIKNNADAVTQAGKEISKKVVFPNMYIEAEVNLQLTEIIRLASAYPEFIHVTLTPRAFLLDIGDFVFVSVSIGSTVYSNVPCMVRQIIVNPDGLRISVILQSMQMTPFPTYTPGFAGTVGGFNATITTE